MQDAIPEPAERGRFRPVEKREQGDQPATSGSGGRVGWDRTR